MDYREYKDEKQLISEQGYVDAGEISLSYTVLNHWSLNAGFNYEDGQLNYTGQTQRGLFLATKTNYHSQNITASIQYSFNYAQLQISPLLQFSLYDRKRFITETERTKGMGVNTRWSQWSLGIKGLWKLGNNLQILADYQSQKSLHGKVTIQLHSIDLGKQSANRDNGHGWVSGLSLQKQWTPQWSTSINLIYGQWHWQKSDIVKFDGATPIAFQEPSSTTVIHSLSLNLGYLINCDPRTL